MILDNTKDDFPVPLGAAIIVDVPVTIPFTTPFNIGQVSAKDKVSKTSPLINSLIKLSVNSNVFISKPRPTRQFPISVLITLCSTKLTQSSKSISLNASVY